MKKTINSKHIGSVFIFALLSLFLCMAGVGNASAEECNPATGHKINDDGICQICGHSFFRYQTSDGNMVNILNKDFGALLSTKFL